VVVVVFHSAQAVASAGMEGISPGPVRPTLGANTPPVTVWDRLMAMDTEMEEVERPEWLHTDEERDEDCTDTDEERYIPERYIDSPQGAPCGGIDDWLDIDFEDNFKGKGKGKDNFKGKKSIGCTSGSSSSEEEGKGNLKGKGKKPQQQTSSGKGKAKNTHGMQELGAPPPPQPSVGGGTERLH